MKTLLSFLLLFGFIQSGWCQTDSTFTEIVRLPSTGIKSQDRTGTCWAWSALSMLESEMMRMGKDSVSLSPMFIAWHTYQAKADKYVRMHGHKNFGQGGEFHDVTWIIKHFGIVPLSAYNGLKSGTLHNHDELYSLLNAYLETLVKQKNINSAAWKEGFNGIINAYLGEIPSEFSYKGEKYTAQSFLQSTDLNPDDYVCLTSFSHHPFYESCILELEDNWLCESCYNVPIGDLMQIMENSINQGYTFAWGADVSENGFKWKQGTMTLTAFNSDDAKNQSDTVRTVTQEMRQKAFDNYETTDDHGMHVIGKAEDKEGNLYFIVKNSWGDKGNFKGYLYASFPYVAYKTTNIMVNKEAIPKAIQKKLGLR